MDMSAIREEIDYLRLWIEVDIVICKVWRNFARNDGIIIYMVLGDKSIAGYKRNDSFSKD